MEHMDTIYLLRECDAGAKMAISSIDEILERVKDSRLKEILTESKSHHEKLCNEAGSLLTQYGSPEKEPAPMAKGMSWLKTNMKLSMDESDAAIADLITDGCNMGIKALHKYENEYMQADHAAKSICKKLVSIEEQLCKELKGYL